MPRSFKIDPYILFKNIKTARVIADLSQEQLAKKIGVSPKTISAYETGRAIPPLPMLLKISEATNTTIEKLLKKNPLKEPSLEETIKRLEEKIANLEKMLIKILKDKND